jgi:hypothetical protein
MYCVLCHSVNEAQFTAEVMIHFSGLGNIENPGVPVYPKVSVCLDCGAAQFTASESQLALLAEPHGGG